MLPNYQGEILDRVIQADGPGFSRAIGLFIFFTLAAGIFDAFRQCAFMVVARRVGYAARCRLYRAILRQVSHSAIASVLSNTTTFPGFARMSTVCADCGRTSRSSTACPLAS